MLGNSAKNSIKEIEQRVLSEVAEATIDFVCPDCGCVLRVSLEGADMPTKFPCGKPFDLILTNQN
jgi:hypothetical protein